MAARVRKDDIVEVIAGDYKGTRGKVLRVIPDKTRVLVEGVNMVYRHVRRSRRNPQGGRIRREAPIHVSNVQPVDPKTGKGTRVRFKVERNASGQAVSKQRLGTGETVLSEVSRAKKQPQTREGS